MFVLKIVICVAFRIQSVAKKYPGDFDRMRRMSIVEEPDLYGEKRFYKHTKKA